MEDDQPGAGAAAAALALSSLRFNTDDMCQHVLKLWQHLLWRRSQPRVEAQKRRSFAAVLSGTGPSGKL